MTNADKFKSIFGLYATELWAKPEKDFLEWLNADVELFGISEQLNDLISRQAAIEMLMNQNVIMDGSEYHNGFNAGVNRAQEVIRNLPPVQPKQTNCEYCHTDRDGYVFPLEKNSHAFIDRDKIVLKAKGWRGEAKIKYCPICGRRLTDG